AWQVRNYIVAGTIRHGFERQVRLLVRQSNLGAGDNRARSVDDGTYDHSAHHLGSGGGHQESNRHKPKSLKTRHGFEASVLDVIILEPFARALPATVQRFSSPGESP